MRTRATELPGIRYPIVQGGIDADTRGAGLMGPIHDIPTCRERMVREAQDIVRARREPMPLDQL